jgi:uncharacterized protein YndB with AHSA1/START domain
MDAQRVAEALTPAPHYHKELRIDAPREKVYQALTTNQGIAGWWTNKVQGVHEEGGAVRVEFEGPGHVMRVEELRNPAKVAWSCASHNFFPEWPSTTMNFELTAESETSCKLSFEHYGLKSDCACYGDCSRGWDHFLASLVRFCETGAGTPWK